MKLTNVKILLVLMALLSACGEAENHPQEIAKPKLVDVQPEAVDIEATAQINDKLLDSMRTLSESQTAKEEGASKQGLEQLSETDRQAIIDLTIEQSADKIERDADEVLKELESSANN